MSDIVKFTPGGGFLQGAQTFQKAKPQVASGIPLLQCRKESGKWVYGPDRIEVEDGSLWAIDANSTAMGYVDWHGGKPVGERMAVVGQEPVNPADLPPAQGKNGWEDQVGFGLICTNGEDAGVAVVYKTNTKGGIEAFNKTFDAMQARAAAGKPFNPVVKLTNTNYTHNEYGLIWKPIFEIVDWLGDETSQVEDHAPATDEEPPAEQPTRRRRRSS